MDILTCIKHFMTVVECQNLTKTAERYNLSPASISKHIAYLERWAGERLLHRTTRCVKPTLSGKFFYTEVKKIFQQMETLHHLMKHKKQVFTGFIRLNLPSTLTYHQKINTVLIKFMQKYPGVNFSLSTRPYLDELLNDTADIVIALKQDHSVDIASNKFFTLKRRFFASPSYLKKFKPIQKPEELSKHNCLVFSPRHMAHIWTFDHHKKVTVQGNLQSDNFEILRQAALAGQGIINIAEDYIAADVKSGTLVPILEKYSSSKAEFYIHYLRYRLTPMLQTFIDMLLV